MGRVLTFSDDRVIRLLKDFVPIAYDRHKAAGRRRDGFFWRIVSQKPVLSSRDWGIESFPAAQGCYTFDSDGTTYARVNDHADVIVDMLKRTKAEFEKRSSKPRSVEDVRDAGQLSSPDDALVARVYSRITPVPRECNSLNRALGRDLIWIPRREVDALVAGKFLQTLTRRLTLAHLRDNVRGEPGLWEREHVRRANFRAVAKKTGEEIRVELSGEFLTSAPHGNSGPENYWAGSSGYEGTIQGELVFDAGARKVTRFVLYAEGMAWGEVEFTPGAPKGKFPLKIAFVLPEADDKTARITPPYGADAEGTYLREGTPGR